MSRNWTTGSLRTKTAARGTTFAGGNKQTVSLGSPVDGYVYDIHVAVGDDESRLDVWMDIVEPEEQFTNLMEYNAPATATVWPMDA